MAGGEAFWAPLSGGGAVDTIVPGDNITVDATDPINPIVSATIGEAAVRDVGRWEVVVDGVPAEAVTNTAGDDWLYVWVGA